MKPLRGLGPWIPFFVDRWNETTAELSGVEKGVLISLYARIYALGEPVKRDDLRLSRVCGVGRAAFTRICDTLVARGNIHLSEDGFLFSDLSKSVLDDREKRFDVASIKARKSWDKRKENQQSENAAATLHQSCGDAKDNDNNNTPSLRSGTDACASFANATLAKDGLPAEPPSVIERRPTTKRGKRKPSTPVTYLPPDWSPPEELFAYGAEKGLTREETAHKIEGYRLWALGDPERRRKANWLLAFKGCIHSDAPKIIANRARAGPKACKSHRQAYTEIHEDLTNGHPLNDDELFVSPFSARPGNASATRPHGGDARGGAGPILDLIPIRADKG